MAEESTAPRTSALRAKLLHPALVLFQVILVILIPAALTLDRVWKSVTPPPERALR